MLLFREPSATRSEGQLEGPPKARDPLEATSSLAPRQIIWEYLGFVGKSSAGQVVARRNKPELTRWQWAWNLQLLAASRRPFGGMAADKGSRSFQLRSSIKEGLLRGLEGELL